MANLYGTDTWNANLVDGESDIEYSKLLSRDTMDTFVTGLSIGNINHSV